MRHPPTSRALRLAVATGARPAALLLAVMLPAGCHTERPPSEPLWREAEAWSRLEEGWARTVPVDSRRELQASRGGGALRAVAFPSAGAGELRFRAGGKETRRSISAPTPIRFALGSATAATLEGEGVSLLAPRIVYRDDRAPRILLVVADTLRRDHANAELMPEVMDYFDGGLQFERAYSASSWTLPSLASIFTGKRPTELRLADGTLISLAEEEETLASDLRARGFRCVAVTANYTVNHENGYSQGFDLFYVPAVASPGEIPDASWVVQRALEASRWLADEPLFLFVQPMEPHEPYRDHERGEELTAFAAGAEVEPRDLDSLRQAYRSEVRYLSRELGRLFAGLGEPELAVLTSDHGEELYEHRGFRHGPTLYPEVVRVPLLVRGPGLAKRTVARPLSLVELRSFFTEKAGARRLLEPERPVTMDTFTHGPPRFAVVTDDRQTVLFARSLRPEPPADDLGRFLQAHHPRQLVIPHGEQAPTKTADEATFRALAAHFAGFRSGCFLIFRGGDGSRRGLGRRLQVRLEGVGEAGWIWGEAASVTLQRSNGLVVEVESPDPDALLFLPAAGEPDAIRIGSLDGTELRLLESWEAPWSDVGVSAWIDPGRTPAEIRGLEATLERLRALGYI